MHSVLNILKYGLSDIDYINEEQLNWVNSLDYLSHIIFTLHEDLNAQDDDAERFSIEIRVNRGAHNKKINEEETPEHYLEPDINKFIHIKAKMTLKDLDSFFNTLFLEERFENIYNPSKDPEEEAKV